MAIPGMHGKRMGPAELAFIAENAMVEIIPRQRLQNVRLISGNVHDLIPPRRARVPLWLALVLKKQRRVNIIPPRWMNADSLSESVRNEEEHPNEFAVLPFAWLELSDLLLDR